VIVVYKLSMYKKKNSYLCNVREIDEHIRITKPSYKMWMWNSSMSETIRIEKNMWSVNISASIATIYLNGFSIRKGLVASLYNILYLNTN
jgi:hypothetical protein